MKAVFKTEKPNDIEMTMTLTMPLWKWKELRDAIKSQYPGWEFSNEISRLVDAAQKHFHSEEEQ